MTISEFESINDEILEKTFCLDEALGYNNVECIKIEDLIDILEHFVEYGGY